MEKVKLPISVDPIKSAQKDLKLDCKISKNLMKRLARSTNSILADIDTQFLFEIDQQKLRIFRGSAKVAVEVTCQRCNEPMIYQCEAKFTYCPVHNQEQEHKLPDVYEAIYYDGNEEINLHDIVEDELILSLPQIAKHAIEDCLQSDYESTFGHLENEEQQHLNPFEALIKLKHR
ncbi:MAG: 23S rRNA accumulation protein YceD [Psychromonas sp.]|nr:23S rRNA accumulation protein YceD [Psychromonas sp.]